MRPTMTFRLRAALLLALASLAGCELCDHLEEPQHQVCESTFWRGCDVDNDGRSDGVSPCDAGVCHAGALPGVCL